MTTLREAAQQALEALNSIDVGYRSPSGSPLEVSFDEGRCEAAITALRAALAQQAEPVEPVAWADKISFEDAMKTGKGHDVWPKAGDYETRTGRALIGLYTSPPQRKPLTEEEKRALADKFLSCQPESYEVSGVFDLISAVERAHGIKE